MGCQTIEPVIEPMTRDRCVAQTGFVFIPSGEFVSGSDPAERDYAYQISAQAAANSPEQTPGAEQRLRQQRWFDWEPTQHQSNLNNFCIGQNLVTNAEYQAFVQATGHRPPGISAADYQAQGFLVHPYTEVEPFLWNGSDYPAGEGQHPVVLVSYDDAIAYAQWKGLQDQQTYRLPTAAEWEKAARGEDGRYFPWGNDWRDDATNWGQSGRWHTSPIAAYPLSRSPYGVEDMVGNVFEYTSTLEQRRDRTVSVMKGCSWDDLPGFCRAAYRHTRPLESRHILFGFRLVRK
ncbi:MAG: SUMF1/EgtB/PvdO family nonheme iron enzyme [Leptolyngbyaceae cyanobacterium MO_188.B28]|nr:SUMF1/EgtB/PvdO family nonheme iron enzyme [Leptolyngbyaceae cyanobacterium MO_188.B28]